MPLQHLTILFFCYVIDCHNHARQFELACEKKWVTQHPYFCLDTTIFAVNVTDCWKGYHWNLNAKHRNKKMGIRGYSDILSLACLENTFPDTRTKDEPLFLPFLNHPSTGNKQTQIG
eukprot:4162946-Ditylum_brightwellii.AAC.1